MPPGPPAAPVLNAYPDPGLPVVEGGLGRPLSPWPWEDSPRDIPSTLSAPGKVIEAKSEKSPFGVTGDFKR